MSGLTELTARQHELLLTLIQCQRDEMLFDVIRPIPTGPDTYVVYLRGKHNLPLKHISDLDALCVLGFLDYEYSRFGNQKVFKLSAVAVDRTATPLQDRTVQCAQKIKQQLVLMLTGDVLAAALVEVDFVRREAAGAQPDTVALRRSLARLSALISQPLAQPGQGAQVANGLGALAAWIDAINVQIAL